MSSSSVRLNESLSGISGILITPFDTDDQIRPQGLRPVVDRAIEAGIHVLTVNGNTGEFYSLTTAEAQAMVHETSELIAGRVPMLAGVGRSLHDAIALARSSREAGAAALMIHQPPDPFCAPRGVVEYVRRVADAAQGLPIVLYLRNDNIGLAAIESLCSLPEVVGVKWASPTPLKLAEAIRACDDRIVWIGGLAETWAPALTAVGARGFTSGLINVWPEQSMAIHTALAAGNYHEANRLIAIMSAFEELRAQEGNGTNVSVVKAALQLIGDDCGHVRAPGAWPLSPQQHSILSDQLRLWGLTRTPG
jgi:4-hydroxy-tetrahydrodipicolinate synthase